MPRSRSERGRAVALLAILAVALVLRLVQIDAPLIGKHAWRQTDTAAIARAYYEGGYAFAWPQVEWRGDGPGYVESELPVYPYLVALLYSIAGEQDALGRLVSVAFSLLLLLCFHALVRDQGDDDTALAATAVLAVWPTMVFFGRTFMSDTLMLLGGVAGIHFFARWLRSGSMLDFSLSAAATSLACLLKPPALVLGAPLLWLAWSHTGLGARALTRPALWLYALLVSGSFAAWYLHAHGLFEQTGLTFGIWGFGIDKWGNWALVATPDYWSRVLIDQLAKAHLTWIGAALLLIGLALPRRRHEERLFAVWLAAAAVPLVVVGRGNYAHDYYQLPLLLPAAFFVGRALARGLARTSWRDWRRGAGVAAAVALLVSSSERLFRLEEHERAESSTLLAAAASLREASRPDDLVITARDGDPSLLYHSDRKGWPIALVRLDPATLAAHQRLGARFVVGTLEGNDPAALARHRELVEQNEVVADEAGFFVVRLNTAPDTR